MSSHRRSRRSVPPENGGLIHQIETAEKVLSFAKLILCTLAAVLLWAARLQWNVADLQVKVVEIQEDRRTKIKDSDAWRHDVDIANVKRDEAIARLANTQTLEAAKNEGARAARAR